MVWKWSDELQAIPRACSRLKLWKVTVRVTAGMEGDAPNGQLDVTLSSCPQSICSGCRSKLGTSDPTDATRCPPACVLSQSREAAAEPEACEVVRQRTDPRTCWLPLQVPVGAPTSEEFKAFLSPFLCDWFPPLGRGRLPPRCGSADFSAPQRKEKQFPCV